MKKTLAIFLQAVVVALGVGIFVFMLWEPHLEGRNVGVSLYQIYFNDLFLAYAYTASIFFFVALYQAFKVLGFVRVGEASPQPIVKALRTIKYCATIVLAFVLGAEAYLFIARPSDDIAGGVFMGLLVIAVSGIVASVAGRFERRVGDVDKANKVE